MYRKIIQSRFCRNMKYTLDPSDFFLFRLNNYLNSVRHFLVILGFGGLNSIVKEMLIQIQECKNHFPQSLPFGNGKLEEIKYANNDLVKS